MLFLIYVLILLIFIVWAAFYISAQASDKHTDLNGIIGRVLDKWELQTYIYIVKSISSKPLQRRVAKQLARRFAVTRAKFKGDIWWMTEKFGEFLIPLFVIHLILLILMIVWTNVFFIYIFTR